MQLLTPGGRVDLHSEALFILQTIKEPNCVMKTLRAARGRTVGGVAEVDVRGAG